MKINNVTENEICSGCGACISICPVSALTMGQDIDGFYKPQLNSSLCIKCRKCVEKCPCNHPQYINTAQPLCYAFNGHDEIQKVSATAGGFQILAKNFISRGGKVAGAAWTKELKVEHILVDNLQDLSKLYKSKYVQSDSSCVYSEIKKELEEGTLILFSGVGCQVAGLYAVLGKEYDNLYTVDLLCHYAPSIKVFQEYVNEKYGKGKVTAFDFRAKPENKDNKEYYYCYSTVDKKEYVKHDDDDYCLAYHSALLKGPQCNNCRFSHTPRQGDLTIGDFHRLHLSDERFLPLRQEGCLVNNKKGEELAEILKDKVPLFVEKDIKTLAEKNALNLNGPRMGELKRNRFYITAENMPVSKALRTVLDKKWDIGLISFFCAGNYGSVFVNNALYKTLREMGFSVLNIDAGGKRYSVAGYNKYPSLYPDCDVAADYDEQYLNSACNMFLLGSDQVMKMQLYHDYKNFSGLRWGYNNKKKAVFGLSFGPHEEQIKIFSNTDVHDRLYYDLSKFDVIYTRGDGEKEVLKKYFDIDCDGTIIDPVFLMDKNYYTMLSAQIPKSKEKYLFAYILDMDDEKNNIISMLAEKKQLKTVVINDADDDNVKTVSIEQWLAHFRDAEIILTDSFHGSCFSVIFNKRFFTIGNILRGKARFSVLDKLGVTGYQKETVDEVMSSLADMEKDYTLINKNIEIEREKMKTALFHCIEPVKRKKKFSDYDMAVIDFNSRISELEDKLKSMEAGYKVQQTTKYIKVPKWLGNIICLFILKKKNRRKFRKHHIKK